MGKWRKPSVAFLFYDTLAFEAAKGHARRLPGRGSPVRPDWTDAVVGSLQAKSPRE